MVLFDTWRITKSKHACCGCGAQFTDSQIFFSCLTEEEAEFTRLDFCSDCWQQSHTEARFCFWRSRRAPSEQRQVVDTDLMIRFFDWLRTADTEKKKTFRFVLALYLMRRKEFKLLETIRTDGGQRLVLERRSTAERVEVDAPSLTEDEIEGTAAELSRLLSAGL